ncbi:MAG: FAD-dependent monooxygenase [Bernardetiaceae bacterium]|nr:FAD-dependent monooxygenase [Bernardetiaceae bacterium]
MMNEKIMIVGGGLVGSLLSACLGKRGYTVDVYEKRPDYRQSGGPGGRSINLALSDRGWRALQQVGADEAVKPFAIPMYGRRLHAIDGKLDFQSYGKANQAIYSISRAGLNAKLIDIAEGYDNVNYHFSHACEEINLNAGEVIFTDTHQQHKKATADVIFGADGAFSAVRQQMQKMPRFNYSQYYLPHGYKELTIPPTAEGEFRMEKNALHIWPRKDFMLIALPNPDGSFTCTLFLAFEGSEDSFAALDSPKAVRHFFEKYFKDTLPLIPNLETEFFENPTSALVTVRCNPWIYDNRFALIGDASHAIVPFYGQGMNSGFEDCRVLNDMIDLHKNDWQRILPAYQQERVRNADAISDLALQNFIEMRDKVADKDFLLRKKIEAKINQRYPDKWIPLYSMVTFSHIPYADALAMGKKQEKVMDKVMQSENIHNNWENINTDAIIASLEAEG